MVRSLKTALKTAFGLSLLGLLAIGVSAWWYVHSLNLDAEPKADPRADASALGFAQDYSGVSRGRILAVVSSAERLLDGSPTGFELGELARAWWVFRGNGYEVEIASPLGGKAPMRLDDDLIDADYAFLNHPEAARQLAATRRLSDVDPKAYVAVYFVGGKGTMIDFYRNRDIAHLLRELSPGAVIGAVCHGPAALLDVRLADGSLLLHGHVVSGFSNAEERFLMDEPSAKLGFLLQDALSLQAGSYSEGPMYLEHVVQSKRLITGQNPWSTWKLAESMMRALGHEPAVRRQTAEERSVQLLHIYRRHGLAAAMREKQAGRASDKRLLLMHAVIAGMQWHVWDALKLARLAKAG